MSLPHIPWRSHPYVAFLVCRIERQNSSADPARRVRYSYIGSNAKSEWALRSSACRGRPEVIGRLRKTLSDPFKRIYRAAKAQPR